MPRVAIKSHIAMGHQGSGKERILNSAMLLFARMPYSATSLRDIAAAAEVDVAYVHRAFGSKAEIFRQALLALTPVSLFRTETVDGAEMIRRMSELAILEEPHDLEDVCPVHLLIQSTLCNEARDIIAEFTKTTFAEPLSRAFGHQDTGRATFALSLLFGLVTRRTVFGADEIRSIPESRQLRLLEDAMLAVMTSADCDG